MSACFGLTCCPATLLGRPCWLAEYLGSMIRSQTRARATLCLAQEEAPACDEADLADDAAALRVAGLGGWGLGAEAGGADGVHAAALAELRIYFPHLEEAVMATTLEAVNGNVEEVRLATWRWVVAWCVPACASWCQGICRPARCRAGAAASGRAARTRGLSQH